MPPPKIRCLMTDCKAKMAQTIAGACDMCDKHFCSKHRLPEDHECSGLEKFKEEAHKRNADKLLADTTDKRIKVQ